MCAVPYRRFVFLGVLLLPFSVALAAPPSSGRGVGGYVQAGNPGETGGLWAKLWLDKTTTLEPVLSFDLDSDDGSSVDVHFGYYWYRYGLLSGEVGSMLPFFHGPNLGAGVWDGGTAFRAGWVGGICAQIPTTAFDIHLQLNPVFEYLMLDNADDEYHTDFYVQLGFHFFF